MKEISKTARELIALLKKKCDQDTCIGVILFLGGASLPDSLRERHDADAHYRQLIDWIKLNPKADQSAILDQQDIIMDLVPFYVLKPMTENRVPHKIVEQKPSRKIAVF